jgi:hypothetical protein
MASASRVSVRRGTVPDVLSGGDADPRDFPFELDA